MCPTLTLSTNLFSHIYHPYLLSIVMHSLCINFQKIKNKNVAVKQQMYEAKQHNNKIISMDQHRLNKGVLHFQLDFIMDYIPIVSFRHFQTIQQQRFQALHFHVLCDKIYLLTKLFVDVFTHIKNTLNTIITSEKKIKVKRNKKKKTPNNRSK